MASDPVTIPDTDLTPPFGAFAPGRGVEALRRFALRLPENTFGRHTVSFLRKLCDWSATGTYDVEVFPHARARLYPRTNRCEKRVFIGPQFWDAAERAAIEERVRLSDPARPFVFFDVGANVGLYSLWVASVATRLGRAVRIVAIEPDATNRLRLVANVAASGLDCVSVVSAAVGTATTRGRLVSGEGNRGEVRLDITTDAGIRVERIADLIAASGESRIDAFKIDIEGYDAAVLSDLFDTLPPAAWPRFICTEVGGASEADPVAIGLAAGYTLLRRTRLNALLVRDADEHG